MMRWMRRLRIVLVVLASLGLAAVACGGGGDEDATPDPSTTTAASTTSTTTVAPSSTSTTERTDAGDTSGPDTSALEVETPASGWTTYSTDDGLPGNDVISIDVNADGTTWAMAALDRQDLDLGWTISTQNPGRLGLARWDGAAWEEVEPPTELVGYMQLAAGPAGSAWLVGGQWQVGGGIWHDMALGTQGVWHYEGDSWTTIFEGRPEPSDPRPVSADAGPNGILWSVGSVGDFDATLLRFDGTTWTTFEAPIVLDYGVYDSGIPANTYVDSQNRVWIEGGESETESPTADITSIVVRLEDETWREFRSGPTPLPPISETVDLAQRTVAGLDGTVVWFMVQLRQAELNEAAEFRILEFDGTEWTSYRSGTIDSEVGGSGRLLGAASDDHLYVAGLSGLQRIALDTLDATSIDLDPELDSSAIRSLTVDPDGVLWIATDAGIGRYVP